MSVIKKMRKQKAVWWARGAEDGYGMFAFAEPVEISCRWDDQMEEFRNAQGQVAFSKAVVYPDQVLSLGDKLMKGELDSNTPDNPTETDLAFEIQAFEQIPNFKATETLYIAHL